MEIAIIGVASLYFLGHILQWFFEKTKIPDLLIFALIGYLLGPFLGIIQPEHLGKVGQLLATTSLIVILYGAGLQLSTKELVEAWKPSLLLSLLTFGLVGIILAAVLSLFMPWTSALLIGLAMGSTSSAVVIPMLKVLTVQPKVKTLLTLESAFTDIFAIILYLVALDAIRFQNFSPTSVFMQLGPSVLISILFGFLWALAWALFKKVYPPLRQMQFAGEAWALLAYGFSTLLGLNGALSVLVLGFSLSNLNMLPESFSSVFSRVPITRREVTLLNQITLILKSFFFIYLGTLVDFTSMSMFVYGIGISLVIFITRWISTTLVMRKSAGYRLLDVLTVFSMGPRGLACAVLATIPLELGMVGGDQIRNIIFATIPFTLIFSALGVFWTETKSLRNGLAVLFPQFDDVEPAGEQLDLKIES